MCFWALAGWRAHSFWEVSTHQCCAIGNWRLSTFCPVSVWDTARYLGSSLLCNLPPILSCFFVCAYRSKSHITANQDGTNVSHPRSGKGQQVWSPLNFVEYLKIRNPREGGNLLGDHVTNKEYDEVLMHVPRLGSWFKIQSNRGAKNTRTFVSFPSQSNVLAKALNRRAEIQYRAMSSRKEMIRHARKQRKTDPQMLKGHKTEEMLF